MTKTEKDNPIHSRGQLESWLLEKDGVHAVDLRHDSPGRVVVFIAYDDAKGVRYLNELELELRPLLPIGMLPTFANWPKSR